MLKQLNRKELLTQEFIVGLVNGNQCLLTMSGKVIGELSKLIIHDIELWQGEGGGAYLFRKGQGVIGIIKNYTPIDFIHVLHRMSFNECWLIQDAYKIANRLNQPVNHIFRAIRSHKNTLTCQLPEVTNEA